MKNIILFLKGFFIGVANIIPGVSGGTLAITLGIFEKLIDIAGNFFKDIKENIKFLIPIGMGAVIAILVLSKVINFCLDKYNMATTFLFIGLIIGGIPLIFNKVKNHTKSFSNIFIFIITFTFVVLFSIINSNLPAVSFANMNIMSYILLFVVGIIAAATMVIPGISGSFVLMMLGYYNSIIEVISNLTKFDNIISNLLILIPFGIGVLIGIILISKLIKFLLDKYHIKTYFAILGFIFSSIIGIIIQMNDFSFSLNSIVVSLITLLIGMYTASKLGDIK